MLNDFEEKTLRKLAMDFVEMYADDMDGQCPHCLWVMRSWEPIHKCLLVDVIEIVSSWEKDPNECS